MTRIRRDCPRNPARAVALIAAALIVGTAPMAAADDGPTATNQKDKKKGFRTLLGPRDLPAGTLGYGPPGPVPGYPGFGLRYGKGYGFGGSGLGTQANGGYPFYGGVGYPHPSPGLRRVGGIVPFAYFAGPGGPTPTCPNFFAPVGPLVPDQPVLDIANPSGGDYGCYTGTVPYPEEVFAPYATTPVDEGRGNPRGEPTDSIRDSTPTVPPPPPPPPPGSERTQIAPPPLDPVVPTSVEVATGPSARPAMPPTACEALGITVEPTSPTRGLRLARITAAQLGAESGLVLGDIIESANGYATERPTDLDWVLRRAAPDGVLKLTVRSGQAGPARVVTTRLR